MMKTRAPQPPRPVQNQAALTLVELLVAVSIASIILGVVTILSLYGLRSFAAFGNYVDLDNRSRGALDVMSRQMRNATAVLAFKNTGNARFLTLTNAANGSQIRYDWDAVTGYLTATRTGDPAKILLSGCDRWDFSLQQRTPIPNTTNLFYPATNGAGSFDVSICKQISMTWKCSRQILGKKLNTESVQTAKIVLRNKR
jgi:hypothetical protein